MLRRGHLFLTLLGINSAASFLTSSSSLSHHHQQHCAVIMGSGSSSTQEAGRDYAARPMEYIRPGYKGADKLKGKVAVVTGGSSGIGRAIATHFAREGAAGVVILYHKEDERADEARTAIEHEGCKVLGLAGDVGDDEFCREAIDKTIDTFGRLDVLVNNAAMQRSCEDLRDISKSQLEDTFRTNIFSHFYLTQAALDHLREGSSIICTTSVNTYMGAPTLVDYTATKGAIVGFVRSLSQQLLAKGIRVNGVAPGPIWTPMIPQTMPEETVKHFGEDFPMKRPAQASEVAPAYVFLASQDSSYFTGQVLHPNGGKVVNA